MNPLQNLKDIHTPTAIENWPPAYGWWLLAVFAIICIYLLITWLIKVRKVRLAKRQALKALQQIDDTNKDRVSQLNQLLKRVAISYFPQQNVQEIHGKKWTAFLIKTLNSNKAKRLAKSFELMQQTLYRPHTLDQTDFNDYQKSVETWIKDALPPRKKVIRQLEQNNA